MTDTPPSTAVTTTGRIMMFSAWLILLAALTLLFARWLDAQHNPNQQVSSLVTIEGIREVSLQRNRFGHYISTGYINGVAVELMLDTGASDIAIPAELADELGLIPQQPIQYRTANGVITAYSTRVDHLRLGDIEQTDLRAGITPADNDRQVLLGMSFLKDLEMVQRNGVLTLRQYPRRP